MASSAQSGDKLSVVGLFAGIGGMELGLGSAGHETVLLSEIDPFACRVLQSKLAGVPLVGDVRHLRSLPRADVLAAGFPCQDLSPAGRTGGISGEQSSLVGEVFRLVRNMRPRPRWIFLENVPFMLNLQQGKAIRFITSELERLGYTWAHRTIDTRAFRLPQRRLRVLLLASRTEDPRTILFGDHQDKEPVRDSLPTGYGFYWTEGNRGVGWAPDAVPTLKGGSGFGIPSPPGIWDRKRGSIVVPDIRDAERLQGFPSGWTDAADGEGVRKGVRWRLVGNAVSVPVARWIGRRLVRPAVFESERQRPIVSGKAWPRHGYGRDGRVYAVDSHPWPLAGTHPPILDFLAFPTNPLSARAASGFLQRARASTLRFEEGFLDALASHVRMMAGSAKLSRKSPTSRRSR